LNVVLPSFLVSQAIPESLRDRPDDERRARLIVSSSLVVALITSLLGLARLLVDGAEQPIAYVLFGVVFGMLVVPIVLRMTASLTVAGGLIPLVGVAGTTTMALLEDGLGSEALFWLILIPLVAVLFVGARGAVVLGGIGMCCLVLLLVADPITPSRLLDFAGASGALGFSSLLGLLYETSRKRADRHKDEFVASVSHELRTPLTSLQGSLGLLDGGAVGELDGQVAQLVSVAKRNAERLGELVDDLLTIRELEMDDATWTLEPMSLRDIVLSAAHECDADMNVVVEGEVPDIMVNTDAERLLRVLRTLIANAIKHSGAGDSVVLRASVRDGHARIAVTDRGEGIPAAFRPHLFEKFTQADGSATRRVGGTGLGLAIAHRIVERLGGRLRFETTLGEGTTFFVTLRAN
jgi:signal transduction histidine kinase